MPKRIKIIATLLLIVFATTLSGCGDTPTGAVTNYKKVTLNFWGVWDDTSTIQPIINSFTALYPKIQINYKKVGYDNYKEELLNAWADGAGPDILSIPNDWIREFQHRLTQMPRSVKLPKQVVQEDFSGKKTFYTVLEDAPLKTPKVIKQEFVDVVTQDGIINNEVYGLPFSIDTLALYYNKAMITTAGIPLPAKNWTDLVSQIPFLTKLDSTDQTKIIQSAIALGGSKNITRGSDILALLMMQNGAPMSSDRGVDFGAESGVRSPAYEALSFYTDFANPNKVVYSWNDTLPNSLEAFTSGRCAYFIGYAYHKKVLEERSPKMEIGVAPMLQIDQSKPVNFARYWMNVVSNKSEHADLAWAFLTYATDAQNVIPYLNATNAPTALRSLISAQKQDETVEIFLDQVLTARSWYRGKNALATETILQNLVASFMLVTKPDDQLGIIGRASSQINATY